MNNPSEIPANKKETKQAPKKTIEKTYFSDQRKMEDYRSGKSSESLLRMKHLSEVAKLYQDVIPNLSWYYQQEMHQIAEKQVIRIDKSTKKVLCKKCKALLAPRPENKKAFRIKRICKLKYIPLKCQQCNLVKKFFLYTKIKKSL